MNRPYIHGGNVGRIDMQELFWNIHLNGKYIGTAPDSLKKYYIRMYLNMFANTDLADNDIVSYHLAKPLPPVYEPAKALEEYRVFSQS
jgi:hypothetical protein